MHDLMHDLDWEVSREDFSTVNDLECKEILPTVRHLSIVRKDQHVNAFPYESFEKSHLQVTPVIQLRSLVFIGQYDSRVLKYFQNIFKEAQSLRLLYVSTTYAGFDSHQRFGRLHTYPFESQPFDEMRCLPIVGVTLTI